MKSSESDERPIGNLLRRLIKAPAVLSVIWPALLVIGGYLAWHRWGADQIAEKFYSVRPSQIEITEPPPFVRTDVVQTVYQEMALEGLSLLDPKATAKIASAFAHNPWVRRVVAVRKLPGGLIDVRVQYRQPVAMVIVEKPGAPADQTHFLPVDEEGILLPTGEFARTETLQYLHINIPGVKTPVVPAGKPFGDSRVEHAAKLAGVLSGYREQANLLSINVPGDPRVDEIPLLELTTADLQTRFWGSPPGLELAGEQTVEMKIQTLLSTSAAEHADLRVAYRQIPQ
ncbi:MAG: hypothetical protein MI861_06155 [Pirellulales bacterium]|nr:hypothetical protein [Pirellulales bacterium]